MCLVGAWLPGTAACLLAQLRSDSHVLAQWPSPGSGPQLLSSLTHDLDLNLPRISCGFFASHA